LPAASPTLVAMKKSICARVSIALVAASGILIAVGSPASAETVKGKLKFTGGKSAPVSGVVKLEAPQCWTFKGKSGQKISFAIKGADVLGSFTDQAGRPDDLVQILISANGTASSAPIKIGATGLIENEICVGTLVEGEKKYSLTMTLK
jgi:hypothetical protein